MKIKIFDSRRTQFVRAALVSLVLQNRRDLFKVLKFIYIFESTNGFIYEHIHIVL